MRGPPALGCFGGVLCPAFSSTPDAAPAKKSAAKALKSPLEAAVSGEAESALFEDNTLRRSIISPRAGAYAKPHGDVSASERRGETAGYLGARQAHVSEDGASVEVPQHETPDQSSEDDEIPNTEELALPVLGNVFGLLSPDPEIEPLDPELNNAPASAIPTPKRDPSDAELSSGADTALSTPPRASSMLQTPCRWRFQQMSWGCRRCTQSRTGPTSGQFSGR